MQLKTGWLDSRQTKTERPAGYARGRQPNQKVIVRTWHTKYIKHHEVEAYERLGWHIDRDALHGTPHGEWSVLGIYRGSEPPPMPVLRSDTEEHQSLQRSDQC